MVRYFEGADWSPFLGARCLDVLYQEASGVPSLPAVLRELETLRSAPLLARTLRETAVERIDDIVRRASGSTLDLILRSVARRSILSGEYDARRVVGRFCETLLDVAIISPRGGFIEQAGHARKDDARALLASVAAAAADVLVNRPDAKRLGLARPHAQIQPDTNLLEATGLS
jgi:hypothetical protein